MEAPSKPQPRPRAWWQYLLAIVLFGAAAVMLVMRVAVSLWPQLGMSPVPPRVIKVSEAMKPADAVPIAAGELAGSNVLLITLDTTRADRIGCYGNTEIRTPNLDALAASGVLFKDAMAPNPTTLPSHASILTGLYPFHHGARANGMFQLSDEHETLAEMLGAAGYATAAFISAAVLDSRYGLAQGFEDYDDDLHEGRKRIWLGGLERTGDQTTDHALEWLRKHEDQPDEQPFFMWVHLFDPHSPNVPPEPYATEYAKLPYDGDIAFVDEQVGRLTFELDKLHLTDKTLIVVVADHGEGLGQHDEYSHGFMLYDSTLHVPLIMACGARMGGRVIEQAVSEVDIVPTVLSLLGVAAPAKLDGLDLTQTIPADRTLYFDNLEALSEYGFAPLLGAYTAPYKYIWGPDPELYDLSADPFEKRDIVDSKSAVAATMQKRLKDFFGNDLRQAAFASPTHELSPTELQKLQALGYAGSGLGSSAPTTPLPDPKSVMGLAMQIHQAMMREDNDHPQAAHDLEKLAARHPDVFAIFRYLGDVYWQLGEYDKAAAAYERGIKLRPDLPLPHWAVAMCMSAQGKYDEAIEQYKEALQIAPTHVATLSELGAVYLRLGKFEEAAKTFRIIFDLTPSHDAAVEGMVAAYVQLGRADEVRELLQQRLEQQPRLLAVRNSLAQLFMAHGDAASAVKLLREGIELFPDRVELINNLALILCTTTDESVASPREAIVLLQHVGEKTKFENYHLLYTLSLAVARQNRVDEAMAYANKARDLAVAAGDQRMVASIGKHIAVLERAKKAGVDAMQRPPPPGMPNRVADEMRKPDGAAASQPASAPSTQP